MRAEMKLATGLMPVALGVGMALMSGMAKAEEKATQPPTGTVSAQTSLLSVGHRPVIELASVYADPLFKNDISSTSTNIEAGDQLYVKVDTVTDKIDGDELSSNFTCDVSKIDNKNTSVLVAVNIPCVKGPDGSIPITLDSEFVGQRIAVDIYAHSNISAAQSEGYTPTPIKSLAYRVKSSNSVIDNSQIPFLRPAYAEVNGKRIEVDRGDPANAHDDVIHLPSAFVGAKMKVFLEGGRPNYRINTVGNNIFSTVTNSSNTHSAEITIKDSVINSNDGKLAFSAIDNNGRPGGEIINFYIKIEEVFLSKAYKATWNGAKTDCESSGYIFPYVGQGGQNGDPGNQGPGSLSHSMLFWGGYSKYSFPNASENHWTRTEVDSKNGIAMTLDQPNSINTWYGDKNSPLYFVCKKVF